MAQPKLIIKSMLDPSVIADFSGEGMYRPLDVKIAESDLTTSLANKINAIAGGGTGGTGTDAATLTRITNLESGKADKTDLANYRSKSVKIDIVDMEATLASKITDATNVAVNFKTLSDSVKDKVDRIELDGYRLNATKIEEVDLATVLADKINSVSKEAQTEVLATVADLKNSKADKTELLTMATSITDLNASKADKTVTNQFAIDIAKINTDKADASLLANCRKKDETISSLDLSLDLRNKIDVVNLQAGNNLSDLTSRRAARTNLGVGSWSRIFTIPANSTYAMPTEAIMAGLNPLNCHVVPWMTDTDSSSSTYNHAVKIPDSSLVVSFPMLDADNNPFIADKIATAGLKNIQLPIAPIDSDTSVVVTKNGVTVPISQYAISNATLTFNTGLAANDNIHVEIRMQPSFLFTNKTASELAVRAQIVQVALLATQST